MSTDKQTIKNWFKTGLKPTQTQFWATWDSFWHKDEKLPISSVDKLGDLLDRKAEENHTHSEYAKNDASSLTSANVISWQQALGVDDLDYVEIPTESGTSESHPYVVVIDDEGKSAKRNATDFGKVDTIDGIEADENKNIALGAVRKSQSNTVTDDFSMQQENGAFVSIASNGLKVGFGGITATYGTSSIYVDNLVPDAAYKFQEILFPKRAVKNVEEKVYPITYIQGVKADETGRVDISGIAWNYTNPSIRYSGLLDKSADATYNQLLGVDGNGYAAKVGLNAVTNAMAKSTDAQKDAFRLASRKSTETYSVGQPRIDFINPPIVDKTKNYVQYVSLIGLNLFLPNGSYINVYKKSDDSLYKTIIDFQVNQSKSGIVTFGEDFSTWLTGEYYFTIYNSVSNVVSIPNKNKILILSENVENLPIPNLDFETNNSTLIFTGNSTNIINTVFNAKSITPIVTSQEVINGVGVEISFNYSGWFWGRYPSRIVIGLCLPDKTISDTVIDLGALSESGSTLLSVPENIVSGNKLVGSPTGVVRNFKIFIALKNGIATIFCSELSHISTVSFNYISDMYLKFSLVDGEANGNKDGGTLGLSGITRKIRL
ncbi:hypothetical protein ACTS9V_06550 [Empedobacter falsenii]